MSKKAIILLIIIAIAILALLWAAALPNFQKAKITPYRAEDTPKLEEGFSSNNPEERIDSINKLSGIMFNEWDVLEVSQQVIPIFIKGLYDEDLNVRSASFRAIQRFYWTLHGKKLKIGKPLVDKLVDAVSYFLDDPIDIIRCEAVNTLGAIGFDATAALPRLEELAASDTAVTDDGQYYVREAAQKAIADIKQSDVSTYKNGTKEEVKDTFTYGG